MNKNLSEDEVKKIPAMIESGMRLGEVAEKLGCSRKTIQNWVNKWREAGKELTILKGRPPMKLV